MFIYHYDRIYLSRFEFLTKYKYAYIIFCEKNHQWKKICPFNKVQSDPLMEIVWYKKKKERNTVCHN